VACGSLRRRPDRGETVVTTVMEELGELVKCVDMWSSQVENVLSDSIVAATSIRVTAQEGVKEVSGRLKSLEAEDQGLVD